MPNKNNVLAIVQARMGSSRFPGKVMREVAGKPLIEILLYRLSRSEKLNNIILATTEKPADNKLADYVEKLGYEVFRGNETDVLDRYYQAARKYHPGAVVRITGDCPLIDPEVVDDVIVEFRKACVDYASNIMPPTFPDGLDTEVFTFQALEKAWQKSMKQHDREHVTPYIMSNDQFKRINVTNDKDLSNERWTVDDPEDFEVVRRVIEHFRGKLTFRWRDIMGLKTSHPDIFEPNINVARNEGAELGNGQKLWKRAKRIIPGGNMLLSKRAEMFLPEQWPTYFSRAKGCKVWDLDGNEYIDMSIMGIGTNILGYGHPGVDEAVRETIEAGNMSTFNCPEEVYLAERLVDIHPWADMARFARTGGEANAIAIRIARAASGKEKVAFCGYHGWHDWYLAANLAVKEGLDGHLLPGLDPQGVPRGLQNTVLPFTYNRFYELESLVRDHDIGVIKMEVMRNVEPEDGFLEKVREIATDKGIILIFDECTSGFRQTFGGLHKYYGVDPDMAVFGKALGNGYAITAVIGRREIMEAAQSTFISSTFWTERIGPAAALRTLDVIEKTRAWEQLTETGKTIRKRWKELADRHGLDIMVNGLPAISVFSFNSQRSLEYKTLITQEMLQKGYLAADAVYVCTEHSSDIVDGYFDELDPVFSVIKECEEGREIEELLKSPVCHSGFRRLN